MCVIYFFLPAQDSTQAPEAARVRIVNLPGIRIDVNLPGMIQTYVIHAEEERIADAQVPVHVGEKPRSRTCSRFDRRIVRVGDVCDLRWNHEWTRNASCMRVAKS